MLVNIPKYIYWVAKLKTIQVKISEASVFKITG